MLLYIKCNPWYKNTAHKTLQDVLRLENNTSWCKDGNSPSH